MQAKQPLFGPGLYYIALDAHGDEDIFQSVFEYENIKPLIGNIEHIQLLAFLFEPQKIQLVIECEEDWPKVVEQLQAIFSDMHYQHWRKRQTILAEQAHVLRIDEAYLMPLIMQIHQQPVTNKQVATPCLYPWSSDALYRMENPPEWINTQKALKQLAQSRRHQIPYYERMILKQPEHTFNLKEGSDEGYAIIGREGFSLDAIKQQKKREAAKRQLDLKPIYQSAVEYIAEIHDLEVAVIEDTNSRQYDKLMPLVIWLILQSYDEKNALAKLTRIDIDNIGYFMRSVEFHHSDTFLKKLYNRWVPPISLNRTSKQLDDSTETSAENVEGV